MSKNPHIDDDRTPTDGLPYYCKICGAVYEGRHCEELNCELESAGAAQARRVQDAAQQD